MSWTLTNSDIEYVRRAQAAATNNPQPMDISQVGPTQEVNSLSKGKSNGKGKGNGKNPNNRDGKGFNSDLPKNSCPVCGKMGDWRRDCW